MSRKLRKGWRRADTMTWADTRSLAYQHGGSRQYVAWLGRYRGWCWRWSGSGWQHDGKRHATIDDAMKAAERAVEGMARRAAEGHK